MTQLCQTDTRCLVANPLLQLN